MKITADKKTIELHLPGAKRGRGRPPTFAAKSNAERQKAYREKRKADHNGKVTANNAHIDLEAIAAADRINAMLIQKLEDENSSLVAEQRQLIEERAAAWKKIEQLELQVGKAKDKAREAKGNGIDWEARALKLTHELDVATYQVKEAAQQADMLTAANKALHQTVTKIQGQEKRKHTSAAKMRDLETSRTQLLNQVDQLTKELKRHAKL